jgi:5-enolpyruvylshikimate-3-phosphate synthase
MALVLHILKILIIYFLFLPVRSPGHAYVEGDASSASYFLAGAAVTGGTVTVEGCGTTSLQVGIIISDLSINISLIFCI